MGQLPLLMWLNFCRLNVDSHINLLNILPFGQKPELKKEINLNLENNFSDSMGPAGGPWSSVEIDVSGSPEVDGNYRLILDI